MSPGRDVSGVQRELQHAFTAAPETSAARLSHLDELMSKTLATATVERLLHHAHICQTSGDSVRIAQALGGKGVSPFGAEPTWSLAALPLGQIP